MGKMKCAVIINMYTLAIIKNYPTIQNGCSFVHKSWNNVLSLINMYELFTYNHTFDIFIANYVLILSPLLNKLID